MPEYEEVFDYWSGNAESTAHLVESEDGTEVQTACGRTLRKMKTPSVSARGGYVFEIGAKPIGEKCGNCPWDEVDDGQ